MSTVLIAHLFNVVCKYIFVEKSGKDNLQIWLLFSGKLDLVDNLLEMFFRFYEKIILKDYYFQQIERKLKKLSKYSFWIYAFFVFMVGKCITSLDI